MKSQITRIVAITPSDSEDLALPIIPIVTVAGNIVVTPWDNLEGQSFTIPVTVGQYIPIVCKRIYATGTTATILGGIAD